MHLHVLKKKSKPNLVPLTCSMATLNPRRHKYLKKRLGQPLAIRQGPESQVVCIYILSEKKWTS